MPGTFNANLNKREMADLIERFLNRCSSYPQEWNDFIDTSQNHSGMDGFREICYRVDPLVNGEGPIDPSAVAELRRVIEVLRF